MIEATEEEPRAAIEESPHEGSRIAAASGSREFVRLSPECKIFDKSTRRPIGSSDEGVIKPWRINPTTMGWMNVRKTKGSKPRMSGNS